MPQTNQSNNKPNGEKRMVSKKTIQQIESLIKTVKRSYGLTYTFSGMLEMSMDVERAKSRFKKIQDLLDGKSPREDSEDDDTPNEEGSKDNPDPEGQK